MPTVPPPPPAASDRIPSPADTWQPPGTSAAAPPRQKPPMTARAPRVPWRQRVPELVATIGVLLVIAAVGGFLSSTWEDITQYEKALVLGAAAVAFTAAGVWADRADRRAFTALVPLLWAAGSATLLGSLTLAASTAAPGQARQSLAIAGLGTAAHAGWLLTRRPSSVIQQLSLLAALLFAAGPFGTATGDRFTWDTLELAGTPLVGLIDLTFTSDAFVITGIAHALIGVVWLALSHRLDGLAATVAKLAGSGVLAFAAMELNVLAEPTGAVAALLIVLGYLVYGLVAEDPLLIVVGSVGALVAGTRVLTALFTGEVLATITVFVAGLAMIVWAFQAIRRRTANGH